MRKKFYIKTYGCQMNVYDSDRIIDILQPLGYELTNSIEDSDLVVLNTCHIREKASEKVYSDIGRIKKIKNKKYSNFKLIIAGCVAQAEGEEIIKRTPYVNGVVGPQSYHLLPDIIKKLDKKNLKLCNTNLLTNEKFDNLNYNKSSSSSALVTIQEGCDKFCTFCVVPYTRGSEYSRPVNDIIEEIYKYSQSGIKEVVLLGQNVNSYHGIDKNNKERGLEYLIDKISENAMIKRIRYMTSHPLDMTENLIKCHGYNEKLMPFIHLPIQSGSDKILKRMNRKYNVKLYLNIIEKLRKAKNDIALSSDFIVGFPGETNNDFKKTMDLINKVNFSIAYSFSYSARPGTPASNYKEIVDDKLKKSRLLELQSLLKKQQYDYNRKFIGKNIEVLIEKKGRYSKQFIGRSIYNQSVFMKSEKDIIGSIVLASVKHNTNFALSATEIN